LRERASSLSAENGPVETLPPAVAADSHATARRPVLASEGLATDDAERSRGRRAGAVSAEDAAPRSAAGRRADEARIMVDPPRAAKDYSGGAGEAAIPPRRRRASRGDITKKAFGGLAFLFVAGIAVATSVPAEAYFAATPSAIVAPITDRDSASLPPGQVLASVAGGAAVIERDAYAITEIPQTNTASTGGAGGAGVSVANAAVGTIQWPLPAGTRISDDFGPRSSPGGIGSTYHEGVDFAPGMGAPIQVVADGVVRLTQLSDAGGYGCYAIVDHNVGGVAFASLYGHMQCDSVAIEEGAHVVAGQLVGLVGSTGASTGAHLHFEIHEADDEPIDPLPWMDAHVTV
jgi:murein DD-endopeptidase MepM/ murein hydrolase activator NlpD